MDLMIIQVLTLLIWEVHLIIPLFSQRCQVRTREFVSNVTSTSYSNDSPDMGESSIISKILSIALDAWEDALTSRHGLVELFGQTDEQHGSLKVPSLLKVQDSNQSKFSFARQEDLLKQTPALEYSLHDLLDTADKSLAFHDTSAKNNFCMDKYPNVSSSCSLKFDNFLSGHPFILSRFSLMLQQWQMPSTKSLLLKSSKFSKGWYEKAATTRHATLCLCRNMQTATYEFVSASYVPTAQNNKQQETTINKENASGKLENVGAFQKLPMVMPSVDIYYSALRKVKRVQPTKGIANIAKRERNRGAKQLDALMKELAVPLRAYLENFPKRRYLHPYERSLVELTLGDGNYEEVLRKVDSLRKKVTSVGKEHASLCAKSLSKREAEERLNEGMEELEQIFKREGKAVDDLLNIAKTLRAMPVVDLETPTLCLVGAPNVGKSSLVHILSTGKPEICNYPFTTRGILMGHIILNYQNFQVTDTPGLLNRCDEDRNNLEKLTLAVLTHLPTAILYVHDLSGECGTSPSDQFMIYKEIRERFSDHLWLDVVSKCDLLQASPVVFITEDIDSDHIEMATYRRVGPKGAIRVSVKSDEGLNELKARVHNLLIAQMDRVANQNIKKDNAGPLT